MNTPDYFMADLPPEATLTPTLIREACQTLVRNRDRHLSERSTESMVQLLATLANEWRDPASPWRMRALEAGPDELGFSRPVLERGLDAFFGELTPGHLREWLRQEIGDEHRLDRAVTGDPKSGRASLVHGPRLLVHVTAGNIPIPSLHSMVSGLLLRSAQFVKCARRSTLLPRLFGHCLHEIDAKAASCLEIAAWPGGRADLEEVIFAEAEALTATGCDETLDDIRRRLDRSTRFVGYGHKVSFGYVTRESLGRHGLSEVLARTARDIAAWDQHGCLSPHVIYVEEGGATSPLLWAEHLAGQLSRQEQEEPRGPLTPEDAAVIALKRDFYRVRGALDESTRIWHSDETTAWTVVYEADPHFQVSCLNRFVYVKPVRQLEDLWPILEPIRHQVSTVGLAAGPSRQETIGLAFARWGARRICPLGQMQKPPLAWHHDGRPVLADLIQWSDLETDLSGAL